MFAKGKGSLTTRNDKGKIDVSSEGPSSGVGSGLPTLVMLVRDIIMYYILYTIVLNQLQNMLKVTVYVIISFAFIINQLKGHKMVHWYITVLPFLVTKKSLDV